jgi:hypothetical protein
VGMYGVRIIHGEDHLAFIEPIIARRLVPLDTSMPLR